MSLSNTFLSSIRLPVEMIPTATIPWDQINNILKNISLGVAALVALFLGWKAIKNLQPVTAPGTRPARLQGDTGVASQPTQRDGETESGSILQRSLPPGPMTRLRNRLSKTSSAPRRVPAELASARRVAVAKFTTHFSHGKFMSAFTTEERLALLLNVLGDDAAAVAFQAMNPTRAKYIRQLLDDLRIDPPSNEEVEYVIGDFHQYFRFAMQALGADLPDGKFRGKRGR